MLRILFIITTLGSLLPACANKYAQKTADENGFQVIYFVDDDGKRQGTKTVKHPDGYISEKADYKDDNLHGTRLLLYKNGQTELEETYVNGMLEGSYKAYYPEGNIKYETVYTNNVLAGIFTQYYQSGQKKEEVTFSANEENGPFVEWHENGNLKWEGTYKNGNNEVGELKKYDESGRLIRKLMCDDDSVCETIWSIDDESN